MKARIFISAPQKGQSSGSTSQDAADELGPGQPRSSGELIVVLPSRRLAPDSRLCGLAAFAAGRVGVVAPVAHRLLGRLGDVVDDAGQELEDIPASFGTAGSAAPRGSSPADDLSGALILGESLEDDGTADHVAAEAHGALPVLGPHRTVCREATVAPGEEIVDDRPGDELLVEEHPEQLRAEEPLDVPGVEPDERPEGAVGSEAPVGDEHVDMWVEVEPGYS